MRHSFSMTGALFSALLTAWYVAAEPAPGATPSFVVHDVAIVRDAIGLPHFVRVPSAPPPAVAADQVQALAGEHPARSNGD